VLEGTSPKQPAALHPPFLLPQGKGQHRPPLFFSQHSDATRAVLLLLQELSAPESYEPFMILADDDPCHRFSLLLVLLFSSLFFSFPVGCRSSLLVPWSAMMAFARQFTTQCLMARAKC
jgi:hypothetical protein